MKPSSKRNSAAPSLVCRPVWWVLCVLLLCEAGAPAQTQSIILQWDANEDRLTEGYYLYVTDLAGRVLQKLDAGEGTSQIVEGLVEGNAYLFHATAYSAEGIESDPSNFVLLNVRRSGAANSRPKALSQSLKMKANDVLPIRLSGQDGDGDGLVFNLVGPPEHGVFVRRSYTPADGAAANWFYVSEFDFVGTDRIFFTASDGLAESAPGWVSIEVRGSNHPPVAEPLRVRNDGIHISYIPLSASDGDGDDLTYWIVDPPANGEAIILEPAFFGDGLWRAAYVPRGEPGAADSFTYVAFDGSDESPPAEITVNTSSVPNRPPVIQPIAVTTTVGRDATVRVRAEDPDGDAIIFILEKPPQRGRLIGSLPIATYRPNSGFTGEDGFVVTASDGRLRSAPLMVPISVVRTSALPAP